jgi:centromere/kinetochore protein ZW10
MTLIPVQLSSRRPHAAYGHMFKVCHALSILALFSPVCLVRQSSESIPLSEILSSLSPTSLSEHLTTLRRDITAHFIEFVLTQPLSITQAQGTGALSTAIEHRLELFPAPPNTATLQSRLDNLSEILGFLNAHLFGAVPSSHRSAFLKSFSKPLTSGILNHVLIPALPTSLSGLPKYLELLERAVKFESEDMVRILSGPASGIPVGAELHQENEIKSWVEGVVSHYQKKRRVDILDHARRMFTDVSSDWHETFQVEWIVAPVALAPSASGPILLEQGGASEPSSAANHPPGPIANGTNDVSREVEIEEVDDDGWGFNDDDGVVGGGDSPPDEEPKEPQSENTSSSSTDPDVHTPGEAEDDAWGWNVQEDQESTPMPEPEPPSESKENGNGSAEAGASGDDPLWDAWDDPPSPPTKKIVPKPATKLEKFSSKGKQGAKPPRILTQPPEPEPIPVPTNASTHLNPNYPPEPASATSLSSSWSSSQQFQSIPPTPASITNQRSVPREFYSVSSGMQDILELVESVMLESSELSKSTVLATYLPAPTSSSSTLSASGATPGSVILNTLPSILDLFRALYPMRLQLELESTSGSRKGVGKGAATEGPTKKAIQFSNDCLYLEERIQELFPASSSGSGKTSAATPLDVWTIDGGLRDKVEDAGKRLKVYGESWFTQTIVCRLFLRLPQFLKRRDRYRRDN